MKYRLTSIVLVAALAGSTTVLAAAPTASIAQQLASDTTTTAPDPVTQIYEMASMFRASDLTGLVHALIPPSKWEEARLAYELHQLKPIRDEKRAEFQEKIARFTSASAVDDLMAEIEPKLEEARPKVPSAMLMGFAAIQMAIASPESELTDEQRVSLKAAFPSFQIWAFNTDFLSSETMRQALTLLTDAARGTGIADLDHARALTQDELLYRAGPVLSAAKDAVRLYGIDLDAIVDTLQVEALSIDADKATVRTTVTVFNAPFSRDHELVLLEGRWYSKDAAVDWSIDTVQN